MPSWAPSMTLSVVLAADIPTRRGPLRSLAMKGGLWMLCLEDSQLWKHSQGQGQVIPSTMC